MNTLTPRAAFVLSSEPHCSHCMIGKNGCPSSRNCFDEEMLDLRAVAGRAEVANVASPLAVTPAEFRERTRKWYVSAKLRSLSVTEWLAGPARAAGPPSPEGRRAPYPAAPGG